MNRLNTAARLSSLALMLASSTALIGQTSESGQFAGKVTNKDGAPIVGATVVLTAPQLMMQRTVRTDANGNFRALLLPPGDYTLSVSAEKYLGSKTASPIRLGMGAQLKQDFMLKEMGKEASTVVVVTATSATVDKSDPKVSSNFSAEMLSTLPATNRSFEGALDLAPGVTSGAGPGGQFGTAVIRGGKTQNAVFNLNGTSVGEDVSGMSPNGQLNTFLVDDTVEDTQVVLSPLHGRYGRTGSGVINVSTISGGNEFSGSMRWYLSRTDWGANSPGAIGQNSQTKDSHANRNLDIVLSGPIWKDHIWFVFSTIQAPNVNNPITIGAGQDPSGWRMKLNPLAVTYDPNGMNTPYAWAPGTAPTTDVYGTGQMARYDFGQGLVDQSTVGSVFYQGKLTWGITPDHTITLERSYNNVKTENAGFNAGTLMMSRQSYTFDDPSVNAYNSVNYKGTLSSSLFMEIAASEKTWTHLNGPQVTFPHVRWYPQGIGQAWPYGTNVNALQIEDNGNKNVSLNVKYITDWHGQHELDFGYQYYAGRHHTSGVCGPNQERFYVYGITDAAISAATAAMLTAAGVTSTDIFGRRVGFLAANWALGMTNPASGTSVSPAYRKYVGVDGYHENRDEGFYVNDVWTYSNHWTILGALRVERIRDTDTDGSVLLQFTSDLSPRMSVKYDVNGDNGHILSFSAAKFTEDITGGTTSQWVKSPGNSFVTYGWSANTGNTVTWVPYSAIVNPANYGTLASQTTNAGKLVGLNTLRNPYITEFALGYRRNRANGSYFSINYVMKDWYKDVVQIFSAYDKETWQTISLQPGLPTMQTLSNRVANSSDIKRSFKSVEIEFKENLSQRVTFGGSYTYSRLVGNDNGGDSFGYPFKTNGLSSSAVTWANQYYTFRDAMLVNGWTDADYAPYGPLLSDSPHKARLWVTYTQPLGTKGKIAYSLLARYDSGYNWDAISGYAQGDVSPDLNIWWNTGTDPGNINPPIGAPSAVSSAAFTYYSSARGAFHQNDTSQIDFRLDFSAPIVWKLMLVGNLQVTNVFNTVQLTNYDNSMNGVDPAGTGLVPTPTATGRIPITVLNPSKFGTGLANPATNTYDPFKYNTGRAVTLSIGIKF